MLAGTDLGQPHLDLESSFALTAACISGIKSKGP